VRRGVVFTAPRRGVLELCFRRALPFGVFAPAVFRLPPLAAAIFRAPAPLRLREGVACCRFLVPLFFAIAVSFLRLSSRAERLRPPRLTKCL
jgi:hypothetical protein